jgi:hypothetical protein
MDIAEPGWVAGVLSDAKQRGWRFREGNNPGVLVGQRDDWRVYGTSRRDLAANLRTRRHLRLPRYSKTTKGVSNE